MIQPSWSVERKRLYRQARHQVLLQMTAKQYSPFDAEGNVVSDERPGDFKRYWDSLSDTERAFEILQNTNAAQFIQFWNKVQDSIPKPPIEP
jgi:hypothetical protein